MKVLFITQDDPIYVKEFFEEFLSLSRDDVAIVRIVLAPPMGQRSLSSLVRKMWDFYGPLDFLRMGSTFVGVRIAQHVPRALRLGRHFSIEQVALSHRIPVAYVADLNDPSFVQSVRSEGVDIIVSVAAPQIIREPLINAPTLGCINVHNGTLPRYRGMLPNFWQIFDGQKSVGTTIHRINASIDDGPILAQEQTVVRSGDTLDAIIRRTKRKGAPMVLRVLRQIRDGTVSERDNLRDEGSYRGFPTKSDVAEFRRRGYRLL